MHQPGEYCYIYTQLDPENSSVPVTSMGVIKTDAAMTYSQLAAQVIEMAWDEIYSSGRPRCTPSIYFFSIQSND